MGSALQTPWEARLLRCHGSPPSCDTCARSCGRAFLALWRQCEIEYAFGGCTSLTRGVTQARCHGVEIHESLINLAAYVEGVHRNIIDRILLSICSGSVYIILNVGLSCGHAYDFLRKSASHTIDQVIGSCTESRST